MSFSSDVKAELGELNPRARHCQLAELAGMVSQVGALSQGQLSMPEDNPLLLKKFFTLLSKTSTIFNISARLSPEGTQQVLTALKLSASDGHIPDTVDGLLLQQPCCKSSYLRGAFLASGSISDPNKGYHFEIVCRSEPQAAQVQQVLIGLGLDAKVVPRKGRQVVYLKEGAQIVDALGLMGAHVSLMNLENVRILREMRGSINRKVNCETANISKTVDAGVRQVEDIRYIIQEAGLAYLPSNLQEIAQVRLEHPDVPLKELGELLTPPLGKSGVNHRLRRISSIADQLREGRP